MKAAIFNIERFAIHDGSGIRTTVFFKGCPLRCPWCANPESQQQVSKLDHWPDNALSLAGEKKSIDQIYAEVIKDKDYYIASNGGMTLSGGEVMLQWGAAKELLRKAKADGIHTAIETCGDVPTKAFEELSEYTDLFLYDVKHMDEERIRSVIGGNLKRILQNLTWLVRQKANEIIIRVPVIPEFNHDTVTITQILELAKRLGIREVHLLPYHALGIHKYERLGMRYQMPEQGIAKEELLPYVSIGEQMGLTMCIGG